MCGSSLPICEWGAFVLLVEPMQPARVCRNEDFEFTPPRHWLDESSVTFAAPLPGKGAHSVTLTREGIEPGGTLDTHIVRALVYLHRSMPRLRIVGKSDYLVGGRRAVELHMVWQPGKRLLEQVIVYVDCAGPRLTALTFTSKIGTPRTWIDPILASVKFDRGLEEKVRYRDDDISFDVPPKWIDRTAIKFVAPSPPDAAMRSGFVMTRNPLERGAFSTHVAREIGHLSRELPKADFLGSGNSEVHGREMTLLRFATEEPRAEHLFVYVAPKPNDPEPRVSAFAFATDNGRDKAAFLAMMDSLRFRNDARITRDSARPSDRAPVIPFPGIYVRT